MTYYLRKIGFFLLTLWAAITLNFFIPRLQGGDAAEAIVQRLVGQGQAVDPAQVEAVRNMLGTPDSSIMEQYFSYLGNALTGNLGVSFRSGAPVTDLLLTRLPATLSLAFMALLRAWARSAPSGSLCRVEKRASGGR